MKPITEDSTLQQKSRPFSRSGLVRASAPTLAVLGALLLSSSAQGAVPALGAGAASHVSYSSADLNGEVYPHGVNTTYYFQYGTSTAYGGQTAVGETGAATGAVKVSRPISGLAPVTVYHYRLVALSSAGASATKDRTFTTGKAPLSLAILGAPNPAPYGGTATVEGTLSGTGNASREVILQSNPFPYTQGFANTGNPELTTATGSFSFPVTGMLQATQFRVITASKSAVVSSVLTENVAVSVTAHVRHTDQRHRVRIYGTVTPAETGMEIGILRVTHGQNKLVAGTILHHMNATSSTYSRVLRIVPGGVYIVLARVTDGSHTSAYSTPLSIR
jgi:hypothetical protein